MVELLGVVGRRVVDAGLASAFLAGLAALAMIATRQPARRRALARAAILATLLTIPLVCLRPYEPVDLVGPIREALGPTVDWIARLDLLPRLPGRTWTGRASFSFHPILGPLLLGYLACAAVGLGRVTLGCFGTAWLIRRAAAPSEEAAGIYATIPFPPGRSRPSLRVSARPGRPVLVGAFRSTILIPTDLDRPEMAEALRLALFHELAHAESSDPTFGLACELASTFWFWLPPLWWIRRQMRLDQEFLADRAASSRPGASARYASTLVEIAAAPRAGRAGGADLRLGSPGGSSLYQRVLMLIRCPFPIEVTPPRSWRGALVVSTLAALFSATGFTLKATVSQAGGPDTSPEARTLFIPQIVLRGSENADASASLPLRLPPAFDLTFEVHANAAELVQIQILGHPLATPSPSLTSSTDDPRWHRVRVGRRDRVLRIRVDDLESIPPAASTEDWLAIQGANGVATPFRLLRLSW